jgi:hypothetical protein
MKMSEIFGGTPVLAFMNSAGYKESLFHCSIASLLK